MPSRAGLIALSARHVPVASFGVRQCVCRTSRAYDQARVTLFTLLFRGMLCVLVTIMSSISNEYDDF